MRRWARRSAIDINDADAVLGDLQSDSLPVLVGIARGESGQRHDANRAAASRQPTFIEGLNVVLIGEVGDYGIRPDCRSSPQAWPSGER